MPVGNDPVTVAVHVVDPFPVTCEGVQMRVVKVEVTASEGLIEYAVANMNPHTPSSNTIPMTDTRCASPIPASLGSRTDNLCPKPKEARRMINGLRCFEARRTGKSDQEAHFPLSHGFCMLLAELNPCVASAQTVR